MDLGAYANIENIEEIAKANGIEVSRLRGYRLMKDEEPYYFTEEELNTEAVYVAEHLIELEHPFDTKRSRWTEFSSYTDYLKDYYLIKNPHYRDKDYDEHWRKYIGIRWDRIHGWKRKALKWEIKKKYKRIEAQQDMFNKYCGRDDILYIHARIGGGNWSYYAQQVVHQPWFIEKVDDSFDSTYCDIYARIKTNETGN